MTRTLLVALALTVLAGCAGKAATRTYPPPSADELLAAVRARQTAVRSMNMESRTTSWLGGERVRGTVQMLVDRSGRLRFEAEVSLQGTVAALAVDRERFSFIDHQKHVFRKGSACPANVAALIRIPLGAAEVAAILLGDLALPDGSRVKEVAWDERRAADVLEVALPTGPTVWVGLHRPNPAAAAWDVIFVEGQSQDASRRWRVAYDDLQRAAGIGLPRLIRFAEPGKSFDDGVEIKIRDRSVNPTFPDRVFTLDPPPGYTVELAPCGIHERLPASDGR